MSKDQRTVPQSNNGYRIISRLGRGNSSDVYLAATCDAPPTDGNGVVALKVLKPDEDDEVYFEEQVAQGRYPVLQEKGQSRLLLPENLIDWRDAEHPSCGTQKALIMKTLAGPSVFELARGCKGGRLPLSLALQSVGDAILSLKVLHSHNIGHGDFHNRNLLLKPSIPMSQWSVDQLRTYTASRPGAVRAPDLKPEHVDGMMSFFKSAAISFDGSVLLIDFGSAYEGVGPEHLTHDARFVINAPERLASGVWGLPSDIWSLGCTMVEILTGVELFRPAPSTTTAGRVNAATVLARIHELLPPWPWEPNELQAELKTLWPTEMKERTSSMLEGFLKRVLVLQPENRMTITEVEIAWKHIIETM